MRTTSSSSSIRDANGFALVAPPTPVAQGGGDAVLVFASSSSMYAVGCANGSTPAASSGWRVRFTEREGERGDTARSAGGLVAVATRSTRRAGDGARHGAGRVTRAALDYAIPVSGASPLPRGRGVTRERHGPTHTIPECCAATVVRRDNSKRRSRTSVASKPMAPTTAAVNFAAASSVYIGVHAPGVSRAHTGTDGGGMAGDGATVATTGAWATTGGGSGARRTSTRIFPSEARATVRVGRRCIAHERRQLCSLLLMPVKWAKHGSCAHTRRKSRRHTSDTRVWPCAGACDAHRH
jgi:hypothetical protein